jgi:hypothetical protein
MPRSLLPLLLGALCLGSPALADDALPYHQQQRVVVIFSLDQELSVTDMGGAKTLVLPAGYYRLDALQKSQAVLTPESFQSETGPFTRYKTSLRGQVRPLFGLGTSREASVGIKLTDVDFSYENIVRAAEVELSFRVQLSSMSSTTTRFTGDVARTGPFVPGTLGPYYSSQTGSINVHHVKLALENHLPIRRPLEQFPAQIAASVRPTPHPGEGFYEIEAGPYEFTLDREALNDVGAVWYESDAHFPMVEEEDYYGHYESSPHKAQVVIREDGKVWIQLGWGLAGRYHGWGYDYTAVLSADEFEQLQRDGAVTVSGTATFGYGGEDDAYEFESPMVLELTTTPAQPAPSSGLTSAVGGY